MIAEAVTALLLLASGVLALTAALGVVRLRDFFLRLHAPSLAITLGSWAVSLASVVYFTASPGDEGLALHAWLIIILLSITAPVTTALLTRAALFRQRRAGDDLPPPLWARGLEEPQLAEDDPTATRIPLPSRGDRTTGRH